MILPASNRLTNKGTDDYTYSVTAKSVIQGDSWNSKGGHTAISAVFLCLQQGICPMGGVCRGAERLAGFLWAGLSTLQAPFTLFDSGVAVSIPTKGEML